MALGKIEEYFFLWREWSRTEKTNVCQW